MAAPIPKRRRADDDYSLSVLQRIANAGICSRVSLHRIVTTLKESNVRLDLITESTIRRASNARASSMAIHIDMPLKGSDRTFRWTLLDPCRLLSESVSASPFLQQLITDTLERHPCSFEQQWRMVIGFDEFAPGNKLKVDNLRKCMVLSFSFLEFDRNLRSEKVWFSPVVLRSTKVHVVEGGWSACLRI